MYIHVFISRTNDEKDLKITKQEMFAGMLVKFNKTTVRKNEVFV